MKVFVFIGLLVQTVCADEFSFMFYNLENAFDHIHDQKHRDWTYLPKGHPQKKLNCSLIKSYHYRKKCFVVDWRKDVAQAKLNQLAKVIKREKPDVLSVCEIENEGLARQLAQLIQMDFISITSGGDRRGIQLAFFVRKNSKLNVLSSSEYSVPGLPHTRNIHHHSLLLNNRLFEVFSLHWPSLRNPQGHRHLVQKRLEELLRRQKNQNIILMGDFNTKGSLKIMDLKDVGLAEFSGTHFYPPKMEWSRLDRFFVRGDYSYKFNVVQFPDMRENYCRKLRGQKKVCVQGTPKRFDPLGKAGFSDHFPIKLMVEIQLNKS